jgi:hypothetical protein
MSRPSPVLRVGDEPPPLDPPPSNGRQDGGPGRDRPKGKPDGRKAKAGERFAVLNAFVDFAVAELSRADIAV